MLEVPNLTPDGRTGRMLLDAGEGTLGQMRRLSGVEGMRNVYEELGMIFISHMHADHHLGLQAVLEDRFNVSYPTLFQIECRRNLRKQLGITSKLYVLGPPQIALSMQESAAWQARANDEALDNVVFINSARFVRGRIVRQEVDDASEDEVDEDDEADVHTRLPAWPERPPYSLRGLLPLAAPAEWGRDDRERGVRRWPAEDVLGWSEAV
jgi:ribonuclease Z